MAVADVALTHDHGAHAHGHGSGPDKSVWARGSWVRAIWVSIVFAGVAIGIAMGIRWALGFGEIWNSEVAATFGLTFWAIGFTVGIGCFDYWWGYLTGSPYAGCRRITPPTAPTAGATTSRSTPTTR